VVSLRAWGLGTFWGKGSAKAVKQKAITRRAAMMTVEQMERRLLMADVSVAINTPLNGPINGIVKAAGEVQKVQDMVDKVHDQIYTVVGHNLPIVGDKLGSAVDTASDAFNKVSGLLKDKLGALNAIATVTGTDIQTAIFAALGPAGAKILPASVDSASKVPIKLLSNDGDNSKAEIVELDLSVAGNLFTGSIDPSFDVGIPGLGLSVDWKIKASVDYSAHLVLGVDSSGFFVDLTHTGNDPEAKLSLSVTTPGLDAKGKLGFLQLHATDGTPKGNTGLTGSVGVDFTDGNDNKLRGGELGSLNFNSSLTASAGIHLHNNVSFGGSAKFPSLNADFDLSWNFNGASMNPGGSAASFGDAPKIEFNNVQLDLGSFFSNFAKPIIDEVRGILKPVQPVIDLLQRRVPVLSDFAPLRSKFDKNGNGKVTILEVIDALSDSPVVKFVDAVVAVDEFVKKIPAGLGSVAIDLGSFKVGEDPRGLSKLSDANAADKIIKDTIKELKDLGLPAVDGFVDGLQIPELSGGDAATKLAFPILEHPESAFNLLLGKDVQLFEYSMPALGAEFHFNEFIRLAGPLGVRLKGDFLAQAKFHFGYDTHGIAEFANGGFSDPGLIFNGFYISDTDKADGSGTNDVPEIKIEASIKAAAELNAIVAAVGVEGGIKGHVYLNLHDPDKASNPPFGDGKLRVGEIIQQFESGPLCIFDIEGSIDAGLNAYVQVGIDTPLGFAGWRKSWDIATVNLLSFDYTCTGGGDPDPILATPLGGGVLRLNMGPAAGERKYKDITDGDEKFVVKKGANAGEVIVRAFGYEQVYTGVSKIFAEGGHGKDRIDIHDDVDVTSEMWGDFSPLAHPGKDGDFDDDIIFSGLGAATLHGNRGNDQLTARRDGSALYGEEGKDTITGSNANDTIDGGADDDVLYGRDGSDTIYGQGGDDVIQGHDTATGTDGGDLLYGGEGNDQVEGGGGNDTAYGDDGNDIIVGGDGNDSLDGGKGTDLITGDNAEISADEIVSQSGTLVTKGTVDLTGGNGNDTLIGGDDGDGLFGQGGNDSLTGNDGVDYMEGDEGNDTLLGGTGGDHMIGDNSVSGDAANDSLVGEGGDDIIAGDNATISMAGVVSLIGGAGADAIYGNDGSDNLFGQGGADYMEGNGGADSMSGGDGADKMIGGSSVVVTADGNDTMNGDGGNDIMIGDDGTVNALSLLGGSGHDVMNGGADNDLMYGQAGNDTMTGGTENDTMFGNEGNDSMSGNNGDDDMQGNDGNDTISGNAGVDVLLGDSGTITATVNFVPETSSLVRTITLAVTSGDGNDTMNGGDDADWMYGQSGADTLSGDGGHDYMEGNQGGDLMNGGSGDDDIIGGSSLAGAADGSDTIDGGVGNDVVAGDNAIIVNLSSGSNYQRYTLSGLRNNALIRSVTLLDANIGAGDLLNGGDNDDSMWGQAGNDSMNGNAGDDDMIGNLGADLMNGNAGDDCLVGDNGTIVDNLLDGSGAKIISNQGGKVEALVYAAGTKMRLVTLLDASIGGNDSCYGGLGNDSIHGGAGEDLIEGDDPTIVGGGEDALFGDLGNDIVHGGAMNDHLYGGSGDDILDGNTGDDIIYGGDGDDSLYADVEGDRLMDWFGNFNNFYVPGASYGAKIILRSPAPPTRDFLAALAAADGATDVEGELVIVTPPSPGNTGPGGRTK
jgi:Ca2+-binding RTX toxin-like protein